MYFNFHPNRVSNQSKVCTQIYLPKRKLHKFATTNSNFLENRLFQSCIIVKRTCTLIFSIIGLIDQSKPCTQVFLQNNVSYINLQLAIRILKIMPFGHALPPNGHSGRFRDHSIARQKEIISTDDRRTDVAYENNR